MTASPTETQRLKVPNHPADPPLLGLRQPDVFFWGLTHPQGLDHVLAHSPLAQQLVAPTRAPWWQWVGLHPGWGGGR